MTWILIASLAVLGLAALAIGVLAAMRWHDRSADGAEMARLLATQPVAPRRFSAALAPDLPEPARRFFTFAIAEGTPLVTVARIEMTGTFVLGTAQAPRRLAMRAVEVLAAPHGFVWRMSARAGAVRLSGSDAGAWSRFRLAGLLPVARLGGNADHARSAFGRCVAEAVFWTPAALLPGPGVSWVGIDDDTARVTLRHDGLEQAVDVTVAVDGRPTRVEFARWSDANPDKTYRIQPFGGVLSQFRTVQGFRLPTRVEAGNFFGTDAYFPFFLAEVTSIRFPERERER